MAYGTLKADSIVYDNSGSDVALTVSSIPSGASPTFTGNVTINGQGDLRLADTDSSNYVGFQAPGTVSSNVLWTLPGADGSAGQQLTTDGSGTLSWSAAVNVQAASLTGTTMASGVVTSSLTTVGTLTGLTIDGDVTFTGASSNGTWDKSANAFVGNLTGNASTATALATARNIGGVSFDGSAAIDLPGVNTAGNQNTSGTAALATEVTVTANNATDETVYPLFVDGNTGSQGAETDTTLNYNPSSGFLTANKFIGALQGDVTGDVTGTASGNAVLTGSTNNEIVTVTGANAIQGEAKLLFNGSTLDFAINNSSQGFKIGATGNHIPIFTFDANRTTANDNLGQTIFQWNGTEVARIAALAGADTTNKDDGQLAFYTRASGSCLAAALTLTTSQNATFAGSVTDSKGNLRSVPTRNETSAYTLVAADAGKCINADNGVTVPNGVFAAGDVITIINMATSDKTITQGSGLTMRNTGDDGNTGNVSVKKYAMCTLIFTSSSVCFFSTTAKA